MKKNIKKILLVSLVAFEIFAINYSSVYALFGGGPSIPSSSSIASQLEQRYHVNTETLQDFGEGLNVSGNKSNPPEVMLFFNPSNPRPGEKITATALPMYFSNTPEMLFYTWYLKRNIEGEPNNGNVDYNMDGSIDIEDYKIAAAKMLAQNGYDGRDTGGEIDGHTDGYDVRRIFGGHSEVKPSTSFHCYIHDFANGTNYELVNDASSDSSTTFNASGSTCGEASARCVEEYTETCTGEYDPNAEDSYSLFTSYNACTESGFIPQCSNGVVTCPTGTVAKCLTDAELDVKIDPSCSTLEDAGDMPCTSFGKKITSCVIATQEINSISNCEHVFAEAPGHTTGDGYFNMNEELFWGTNFKNPDTASTGYKDEANVVGRGAKEFTWNYAPGDKVGVAVEGKSMIPTKYEDPSMMIMWALPKNECDILSRGSITKQIRGYNVTIPTAQADINSCLEDNLVDPMEGGQPKALEVFLSYSPDEPYNDAIGDNAGDRLLLNASVSNSTKGTDNLYYKWRVEASPTNALDRQSWQDITPWLYGLPKENLDLTPSQGIDLSTFGFNVNILKEDGVYNEIFGTSGVGYLRVYVEVDEHFDSNITRHGKSDVIIKITSSDKKMTVFKPGVDSDGKLTDSGINICERDIDKEVCFIAKNEIIGVKTEEGNLSNYAWELNGKVLSCDTSISNSPLCYDNKATGYNFFPVEGDSGDTYVLTLTANDIISDELGASTSGKTVNFRRKFKVVEPYVEIIPISGADPKWLGTYMDIDGTAGGDIENYSDSVFVASPGSNIQLAAEFHPGFIGDEPMTQSTLAWTLDGIVQDVSTTDFGFSVNKIEGEAYNVSIKADYNQSEDTRKALYQLWGIRQTESPEKHLKDTVQVEIAASLAAKEDKKEVLASLFNNLPEQIMFLLRIALTIFVIILTTSVIFSFNPRSQRAE